MNAIIHGCIFNPIAAGRYVFTATARPSPAAGPVFELLMLPGSVLVHGGTMSYLDMAEKIDVQLANVQVDAGTISYLMPFDVTASASFENSATPDIQLTGNCFIPSRKFSAELAVHEFDFIRIRQYLSAFGIPLNKGCGEPESDGQRFRRQACTATMQSSAEGCGRCDCTRGKGR